MTEVLDTQAYVRAVRSALADLPASARADALAELEANLRADIERRGGNPAAECAAIADLGTPEEYAAAIREALIEDSGTATPQGRILGMPYEFRAPTAARVMERMWNPADPRIMVPRTWGVGWTINFGAIAVRLGLARPDDVEERPLENLPQGAFTAAVAVPLVIAVVAVVLGATYWTRLPAQVPMHFDGAGVADDWGPKNLVLGILLAIAAGAPVIVLASQAIRRISRGTMAITSVLLTFLELISVVILGYTIVYVVYSVSGWWIGLLIVGSLLVPGTMLYLLARASIKREWRAALPEKGKR